MRRGEACVSWEGPREGTSAGKAQTPDGRLTDISRGVIRPLKDEGAKVTVVVNVDANGNISDQTLRTKVKETLQQLGTTYDLREDYPRLPIVL